MSAFVAATNVVATKRQVAVRTANSQRATEGERVEARLYLLRVAWLEARAAGDRRKMFASERQARRLKGEREALRQAAEEGEPLAMLHEE